MFGKTALPVYLNFYKLTFFKTMIIFLGPKIELITEILLREGKAKLREKYLQLIRQP